MPTCTAKSLTQKQLVDLPPTVDSTPGKYLVVELKATHLQLGCTETPAGTRGLVISDKFKDGWAIRFPLDTFREKACWSDGHIRVINPTNLKPVGRINCRD
jgi:hypothetical protein